MILTTRLHGVAIQVRMDRPRVEMMDVTHSGSRGFEEVSSITRLSGRIVGYDSTITRVVGLQGRVPFTLACDWFTVRARMDGVHTSAGHDPWIPVLFNGAPAWKTFPISFYRIVSLENLYAIAHEHTVAEVMERYPMLHGLEHYIAPFEQQKHERAARLMYTDWLEERGAVEYAAEIRRLCQ